MFWAEIWKILEVLSKKFQFLEVKCSIYLNRHVFEIETANRTALSESSHIWCRKLGGKIPRKCNNQKAQPSRAINRRKDEEQIRTTQTPHMNHRRTKKEKLQRKNHLGTISRKTTVGLKPVLLARKLTLNSDAALNYKKMFGPRRGPLSHLWNTKRNTYNHKHCDETNQ